MNTMKTFLGLMFFSMIMSANAGNLHSENGDDKKSGPKKPISTTPLKMGKSEAKTTATPMNTDQKNAVPFKKKHLVKKKVKSVAKEPNTIQK